MVRGVGGDAHQHIRKKEPDFFRNQAGSLGCQMAAPSEKVVVDFRNNYPPQAVSFEPVFLPPQNWERRLCAGGRLLIAFVSPQCLCRPVAVNVEKALFLLYVLVKFLDYR